MRDPRAVLCVDDPHPPYGFIQVQGVATLSEDSDELLDIATRTGVSGELVVRIRPTKVIVALDVAE
ncbi:MAG: class probable F420-dependent enzyme [Mycobacterium sp.]|nr:class probable F420-dependent enzyme [Mycobacterium sp.]